MTKQIIIAAELANELGIQIEDDAKTTKVSITILAGKLSANLGVSFSPDRLYQELLMSISARYLARGIEDEYSAQNWDLNAILYEAGLCWEYADMDDITNRDYFAYLVCLMFLYFKYRDHFPLMIQNKPQNAYGIGTTFKPAHLKTLAKHRPKPNNEMDVGEFAWQLFRQATGKTPEIELTGTDLPESVIYIDGENE